MRITFWGGAQTVTGSMYHIRAGRTQLVLECGLYQGKRKETYARNRQFPFDLRHIDAVVLSHAHIDHSGNIPNLTAQGYDGPIYATDATRDLCASMLPDSGRIHEQDVAYVNKKRARQGLPPMEPLYTEADAIRAMRFFVGLNYGQTLRLSRDVKLTFYDAGHILGSAMVLLEVREEGKTKRLLFSGDLGQPDLPIIRDPTPMPEADYLMIESTYGDRLHPPLERMKGELAAIIDRVVERKGRIVIPAFAVGRTQDIVYDLHQLHAEGRIPPLPVYVDSPLATDVTQVFRLHPECYDAETWDFLHEEHKRDPLSFSLLRYTHSVEESKALNDAPNPLIIISASGMAEAGRVQHHLKHAITDPRNAVIITGWQAPNTLGRRIAEKQPYVKIFGEQFPLRAEVYTLYGYSAHGDRDDLLNWAAPGAERIRHAFVIHGDPQPAHALAQGLRKLGYERVDVPQRGDSITL